MQQQDTQESHPRHGPFAPGHRRLEPFLWRAEECSRPARPRASSSRSIVRRPSREPSGTAAAGGRRSRRGQSGRSLPAAQPRRRAAQSPRLVDRHQSLFGSIALKGARLDDIALKNYRETTDPNSPNIVLLSPSGAPDGYFVDINYVAPRGVSLDLPDSDSLWTADGDKLTEATPVTLSFDNGKGLVFKRKISVDDAICSPSPIRRKHRARSRSRFFPTRRTRAGPAQDLGLRVLHEGFIGVIGARPALDRNHLQGDRQGKQQRQSSTDRLLRDRAAGSAYTDKYWATAIIPDAGREIQGLVPRIPGRAAAIPVRRFRRGQDHCARRQAH